MFVDQVEVDIEGGKGGSGAATFRKEKYVAFGGPNGGDGGRGGHVVAEVDQHLSTLLDFRYKSIFKATNGGDGAKKNCGGKIGDDLIIKVPVGTAIYDAETNELIADLSHLSSRAVIAKGGIGGRGNQHFATPVHQAPRFSELGEPGQARRIRLELKLLADVGLLGFPSTGKSTLIAAVSAARPKIAAYPFTTLIPNLGVVGVGEDRSFVMADLPGLIEGAHEGAGLGHQFLRHVERTRILIHVLDVSGLSGRDPLDDFRIINEELKHYSEQAASLPQLVALNKIDILSDLSVIDPIEEELKNQGYEVYRISAAAKIGLTPLLYRVVEELDRTPLPVVPEPDMQVTKVMRKRDDRRWEVQQVSEDEWVVVGKGLERIVVMTNLDNEHGLRRLQRSLDRIGVYAKLREAGAKTGDTVRIGVAEFDYDSEE